MDLKAAADRLFDLVGGANWGTSSKVLIFVAIVAVVLYALRANGFLARAWKAFEETVFNNWQLALLGGAALVLSLAGGYTTWDGMKNFTGEPVLSLMFTFGIHGVMLIVAWLIGESFASGMNTVAPRSPMGKFGPALVVISLLAAVFLVAGASIYEATHGISSDNLLMALLGAGSLLLALALVSVFAKADIVAPYIQAVRIIAKNAILWVMFLACMSTSVFFSFDSRFNVVFPAEERKRVADLRAQNQVTGILADIEATMNARRLEQSKQLFESDGWKAYDTQLNAITREAQGAQNAIETYFIQLMEERRRAIAQQQERITSAQSGQVGLANKKVSITEELARLKGDRPGLAAEYSQHKSELDAKQREVDAKRVEAMAEDRGVEGTGKQGRGPAYRERMTELGRLQDEYKIKDERTKDAQKRLAAVETRIAQIERELSNIDGDLAKLKGEAQTAEQRIRAAQEIASTTDIPKVDPARALAAFEAARGELRQEPNVERLGQVQQLCSQLYTAMTNTPPLKDRVRNIDCDPKTASDAAAPLFTLNAGFKTFDSACAGGDKLAQYGNADALFGFARKCLADSGLPSKDTDALRTKISFTELTRDDRAHRFVVSWNAFSDGNRLAYLSLAIAIGIDSLIFMTGLFGANAVRSPLADVPSLKPRNSQQLEAIIENALLPDRFDNAALALEAMHPITPRDGFTAEVVVPWEETPSKHRVLKVLNAGATIGAVARDETHPDTYLVRPELFEFLSIVAKKEFESNKKHATLADLERMITVALLPDVSDNADIVLNHMHPIREERGFMAEIRLDEIKRDADRKTVRNALNAGATADRVQRAGKDASHYYIHGDFFRALARIRARLLVSTAVQPRIAGASANGRFTRDGGILHAERPAVESAHVDNVRLTDQTAHAEKDAGGTAPEQLEAEALEAMLRAIEMSPADYERLSSPSVMDAAVAAGQALQRLAERNDELREYVRLAVAGLKSRLDTAKTSLRASHWNDRAAAAVFDQVYRSILERLPALLLNPQAGFLGKMIDDLEAAAGPDDGQRPGEQPLLDWLRHLDQMIGSADLSQVDEWQRIQSQIEREGSKNVVFMPTGRKQAYN